MKKKNEILAKRLVAFVGPSGSGKDTLMVKVRDLLISSDIDVHIVKRWITRVNDNTEQFLSVNTEIFNECIRTNKFCLYWEIYGNKYGIPREEIEPYLESDYIVLVNLSRSVLNEFKLLYPRGKIVVIDISNKLAVERIKIRKRDTGVNLEARINRLNQKIDIPFPDLIIKNEGKINVILCILMEFLRPIRY